MFSGRGYVVTAIIVGLVTLGLSYFFAPNLTSFINQTMAGARPLLGDFVIVIGEPLKWLLAQQFIGALLAAVFWPLVALEVALLFVMILVALGGGTVLSLGSEASSLLNR